MKQYRHAYVREQVRTGTSTGIIFNTYGLHMDANMGVATDKC